MPEVKVQDSREHLVARLIVSMGKLRTNEAEGPEQGKPFTAGPAPEARSPKWQPVLSGFQTGLRGTQGILVWQQ